MKLSFLMVKQPIGQFYIASINAGKLVKYCYIHRRDYNPQLFMSIGGVQRKDSKERINQIKKYSSDPDSTFPSSIIVSVDSSRLKITQQFIEFPDDSKELFEIIDGQHRILGLNESEYLNDFEIPVVIMPDLTEEEKAYVFSTINSNQKKIDPSLIYDLFEVSQHRSPQRTIHEVARAMNSDESSPFYRKLKMLGYKTQETEILSQGTFVNALITLISKKPKDDVIDIKNKKKLESDKALPLRNYFINDQDEIIYKIIYNYFSAIRDVFPKEWANTKDYIICRTTGFGGLCMALERLVSDGYEKKTMDYDYFYGIINKYRLFLDQNHKKLTSEFYPSNISLQRSIRNDIISAAGIND
jgi:DGQHR domain-containing protein